MEPFTYFAAVAGVAALTLQAIKALNNDVQSIKDVPAIIKTLKYDLDAVAGVLQTLETGTKDAEQHLSTDANAALATALENCKTACETFHAKLKGWLRHSTDQHMHWRDRVHVGMVADKNVAVLSKQLLQSKVTINAAIGTITLLTVAQSRKATQDIQTTLQTHEATLKQAVGQAEQDIEQTSSRLALLHISSQSAGDSEPDENMQHESEDLNAQHASLQCTRNVLQALMSDIHYRHTGQRIRDIEMSEGGSILVGQFNVGNARGSIQQEISNVKATKTGKGIVGIAEGLDINAFFK